MPLLPPKGSDAVVNSLVVETSFLEGSHLRYEVNRTRRWICRRILRRDLQSVSTLVCVASVDEVLEFISADAQTQAEPGFFERLRGKVRRMAVDDAF
jgi:hypothetical protein